MATKLGLFNNALIEVGHETLADTGEPVDAGRKLNEVYDEVVSDCLEAASWNFAVETIKADADTGVEPAFGYSEVFAKPSDFKRTIGISQDEYFTYPLLQFYDDQTFWSADFTPIYVRYVSDDTGLGLDLSRWPASFRRYVELELAERVCFRLTQSRSLKKEIGEDRNKARKHAKIVDTMNEQQPKFAPAGSWTTSRAGRLSRGDRGSRSNLTG